MLKALRRRLARGYLLGLALMLVAYSLATFGLVRSAVLWGLDQANANLATPVVAVLAKRESTDAAARKAIAAQVLASDERLEVLAPGGQVIASSGPGLAGMPLTVGVETWRGKGAYRVLTSAVRTPERGLVYVRAAHALARPDQALATLVAVLAGMFPLALLLAWALGDWLAGEATAPVEAALEREHRFMRDAAHELRTPLAGLQAKLALAETAEPGEATRQKVRQAAAIARRMGSLVADLLALSREDAAAGGVSVSFELEDLLDEEISLVLPLARERDVAIEVAGMPEDTNMVGDPERVARVVRNLLDNAVRYAPRGGHVEAGCKREGGWLRLHIANDGPPIAPEERERLFGRFFRGARALAERPEGTGLGLAISRAIARAHGGELALTSGVGERPAFTLTLPIEPRPAR